MAPDRETSSPRALEGFDLIDRLLERARQHAASGNKEQLLEVGRLCEEVVIALAQALYRAAVHEPREGPKPGASPRRRLDAYIEAELAGPLNVVPRTLARSSLESADAIQQVGTADIRSAALCLEATKSLVNVLRISAGQDDIDYTVGDLIKRVLEAPNLGSTHRYSLELLSRMEIAKKSARKLTAEDLIEHCQLRRKTVAAATVNQDISFLRSVFTTARDVWNINVSLDAFQNAKPWLHRLDLVGKSSPRTRRPTGEELQKLLDHFERQDKHPRSRIPMKDLVLFALYSGRRISEICRLKWSDLDEKRQTCVIQGVKDPAHRAGRNLPFRIVGPAWDIIERQRQRKVSDRIFPYNAKSASQRYTDVKRQLGIENLRFQDLRREAAIRLYKDGYSVETISQIIGRSDLNSLRRDIAEAVPQHEPEGAPEETSA